jgi:uncharacterized metal-binding protein
MSETQKEVASICAKCPNKVCYPRIGVNDPMPDLEEAPTFCPMRRMPELLEKVKSEYEKENIREFARLASKQEAECYEITPDGLRTRIPRLEEVIQFAKKCNYKTIGVGFCIGLKKEMKMVTEILETKGLKVVSVNCKVGAIPKEFINLKDEEKILPGTHESMCNPIGQAEILNNEPVDFAIMLGLCVGHDTLFLKYLEVPCTVLAVKDRVLGHNPLAACYLSEGPYYSRMRMPQENQDTGEKVDIRDENR